MAFERKDDDSTTVLVKLSGNPLNYIMSLKAKYLQTTGKDLHKGNAISLLLNKIPKKIVEDAIKEIINEIKPRK